MTAAHLAGAVQRARHDQRLTQEDVETRGGPSIASLRTIENGRSKSLRPKTLRSLEVALGWPKGKAAALLNDGPLPGPEASTQVPDFEGPIADSLEMLAGRLRKAGRVLLDQNADNAAAVRALRAWCDATEYAASLNETEPVFQARMQLVDEVRALLPAMSTEDPSP